MPICEICGHEHSYVFDMTIADDQTYSICPTCFLLACPTYNQLKSINRDDISKSKYPAVNTYLYKKLCNAYSIPVSAPRQSSGPSKKKSSSRGSSKDFSSAVVSLKDLNEEPFVGRETDIKNILNILGRKNKRNPIILGAAGTGKTAIVRKIASMINHGNVPEFLSGKEIDELNISKIISGTKYRGDLEKKLEDALADFEGREAILFLDDIHLISSSGGLAEDNQNIANILKPYIINGDIQVIGTSTIEDYRRSIEPNKSLSRLFQPVYLEEQPLSEVKLLMKSIAPDIAAYHGVTIPENIVNECIKLADQYIKYRNFPDKAIDLLDMACSRKKNSSANISPSTPAVSIDTFMESEDIRKKLNSIPKNIDLLTMFLGGGEASRKQLGVCSAYIQDAYDKADINEIGGTGEELTFQDLADVVEFWTKIPVRNMSGNYKAQLKGMAPSIKKSVIGQDEAVDAIVAAISRRKLGISKSKRPASFIFVGETGVGKTELAKALTTNMFGAESKMIRFDMSEYMEPHSVSKLIGAPPGYVGYTEAGQLTEALRRNPFSVVLFDEIEKAHSDVSNILLQILDDGRITDAKGELIDASNAIIILTSNAGANNDRSLGFGRGGQRDEDSFKQGLMSAFRPEFLGRVDGIITFNTLTEGDYKEIARIHLQKIVENLQESYVNLSYSEDTLSVLCAKADTNKYHAREIARTVTKHIEDAIAAAILDSEENVEEIHITADDGEIKVMVNDEAFSMS